MRHPKTIAVVGLTHPFRGGIAHYSTLLVRELRKRHHVTFLALSRQYPSFLFPGKTQYDDSSAAIVEDHDAIIDSINPITWVRTAFYLKRQQIDLVVVQWWNPFFGLAFGTIINLLALMSNMRVCFLCHNVQPHESTLLDRVLSRYAFWRVKFFITHSEEDRQNLLALKPNAIIRKNLHATYSIFSHFKVYEKDEAREILDISRDKVLLFFGLVRAYKGLKYLISAMREIVKEIDCTLLIVGEFYEPKDAYEELIDELDLNNHVMIIDQYIKNEDVPLYFGSADVVVLPYIDATQSGIVQIAFGFNKPVISTNVGGLPEAIQHEQTGFVVEKESSESLASAVVRFYQDQCEDKFVQAIQSRTQDFSWDMALQSIESFLPQHDDES